MQARLGIKTRLRETAFYTQQIRQIPIFLGRKKRSSSAVADGDRDQEVNDVVDQNSASLGIRDEDFMSTDSQTAAPMHRADGSRLEEISFVLNGKEEKYVVAKEVEAVVDHFGDQDDLDFGL